MDDDGMSDPYVVFRCAGKKVKSQPDKDTLDPEWSEELVLDFPADPNAELEFEVTFCGESLGGTQGCYLLAVPGSRKAASR